MCSRQSEAKTFGWRPAPDESKGNLSAEAVVGARQGSGIIFFIGAARIIARAVGAHLDWGGGERRDDFSVLETVVVGCGLLLLPCAGRIAPSADSFQSEIDSVWRGMSVAPTCRRNRTLRRQFRRG